MSIGLYKIVNTVSGKIYIGSSKDVFKRLRQHTKSLLNNTHHCCKLQNSFNVYGLDAFSFCVIGFYQAIEDARDAEQSLLNIHYGNNRCYNSSPLAALPFNHKHVRQRALQSAMTSQRYKESHRNVCLKRNADPAFQAKAKAALRNSAKHKAAVTNNAKTVLQRPDVVAKMREALKNSIAYKEAARKVASTVLQDPLIRAKNLEIISCKVVGTNLKTKEKVEFKSQSDAARWLLCSPSSISSCCSGKVKSVKGYVWSKKSPS
jgi:group I intron endonuclease